jgi:hypothetical protein
VIEDIDVSLLERVVPLPYKGRISKNGGYWTMLGRNLGEFMLDDLDFLSEVGDYLIFGNSRCGLQGP